MRNYVFEVNDGARHWIAAPNEHDAMAEWMRMQWQTGEWPPERPTIVKMDDNKRIKIDMQNGFGALEGRAYDWAELTGTKYLGCSEW